MNYWFSLGQHTCSTNISCCYLIFQTDRFLDAFFQIKKFLQNFTPEIWKQLDFWYIVLYKYKFGTQETNLDTETSKFNRESLLLTKWLLIFCPKLEISQKKWKDFGSAAKFSISFLNSAINSKWNMIFAHTQ